VKSSLGIEGFRHPFEKRKRPLKTVKIKLTFERAYLVLLMIFGGRNPARTHSDQVEHEAIYLPPAGVSILQITFAEVHDYLSKILSVSSMG